MPKSMKQLAADALAVQDACNLVAVVNGFVDVLNELRTTHHITATDELRNHPISQMWATKISDLTGHPSFNQNKYGDAYQWCEATANAPDMTTPLSELQTELQKKQEEIRRREADEISDDDLAAAGDFYDNLKI